jgi:hypothetical protein
MNSDGAVDCSGGDSSTAAMAQLCIPGVDGSTSAKRRARRKRQPKQELPPEQQQEQVPINWLRVAERAKRIEAGAREDAGKPLQHSTRGWSICRDTNPPVRYIPRFYASCDSTLDAIWELIRPDVFRLYAPKGKRLVPAIFDESTMKDDIHVRGAQ